MPTHPLLALLGSILIGFGAVLLLGLAIFIHELGHFLAARWLGLTVDAFSIGFGPALWQRKIDQTRYRISLIPFGGYVALPQLDPSGMEKIQGTHDTDAAEQKGETAERQLPEIAPWRRIIVALAGPSGNILLAILLAWAIYFVPDSGATGADTTIGMVAADSPAWEAGLRVGDRILSLNNNRVHNWNEFIVECHLSGDTSNGLATVVQRGTEQLNLTLPVARDPVANLIMVAGIEPRIPCVVGQLLSGSAAEAAGLQPRDEVVTLDGVAINGPADMARRVDAHGARPLLVGLLRQGAPLALTMTPRFDEETERHLIGIVFESRAGLAPQWMQYRQPSKQLKHDAGSVVRVLRALFTPRTKGEAKRAASALGGPLSIIVLLWLQVKSGLLASMAFLRFLCVNLALINLLPLPVLDGGHIIFALYETVSRRKPNARLVTWLYNIFAFLLIGLMVLLVFRDARSIGGTLKRLRKVPVETAAEE